MVAQPKTLAEVAPLKPPPEAPGILSGITDTVGLTTPETPVEKMSRMQKTRAFAKKHKKTLMVAAALTALVTAITAYCVANPAGCAPAIAKARGLAAQATKAIKHGGENAGDGFLNLVKKVKGSPKALGNFIKGSGDDAYGSVGGALAGRSGTVLKQSGENIAGQARGQVEQMALQQAMKAAQEGDDEEEGEVVPEAPTNARRRSRYGKRKYSKKKKQTKKRKRKYSYANRKKKRSKRTLKGRNIYRAGSKRKLRVGQIVTLKNGRKAVHTGNPGFGKFRFI